MKNSTRNSPTLIGHIESVNGGILTVRLLPQIPSLVLVEGNSFRIGQIGSFIRIPLGYTQLYAVCTVVGAAASPSLETSSSTESHKWMSATLFGEALGGVFERGIAQYPTIENEVHVVTPKDMEIIYSSTQNNRSITVGHIAASSGVSGNLDIGKFVTRHTCIVGSTGSGKSNCVSVILNQIASANFPSSRVIVIDPHGEYSSAVGNNGYVFRVNPRIHTDERKLFVPFWALPFEELKSILFGGLPPNAEAAIRDEIVIQKQKSMARIDVNCPPQVIGSDSPVPFSIKQLWFELDTFERQTFNLPQGQNPCNPNKVGNANTLISNEFPPAALGAAAPFKNPQPRNITRQLELLKSRLLDSRFNFILNPGNEYTPDLEGNTTKDLSDLVASWVGHDKCISVLDISGLPTEVLEIIVGTLLRLIYDSLFWSFDLPVSGRNQPLLIVLEEAHLFLPNGQDSSAHRSVSRIAKEGRKYGVGLCVVSQRPSEIDTTVLSQCGTMVALRLSNAADRSRVQSAMPDDLGALANLLPALRTGEGLALGEAMPIPSRIQFFEASNRPRSEDPSLPETWRNPKPDKRNYELALKNWRYQHDTQKGTE